jgi:hypothetical protein
VSQIEIVACTSTLSQSFFKQKDDGLIVQTDASAVTVFISTRPKIFTIAQMLVIASLMVER